MTKKLDGTRYEVIVQEEEDSGDLLIPLPPELLQELGWTEGDQINFSLDDQGRWIIKKL